MIKIASLIKLHDGYSTGHSLQCNLGDGFLCSRNAFFAAIRDWAIEQGLHFSTEYSPLWRQYQSLPFFSLQDIFDARVVPYMDNVTVFRNALQLDPSLALPLRFMLETLKKNYILHESSHYVAYKTLEAWRNREGAPGSDKEWFVTYCLLSECMARMMERFAIFSADSEFHSVLLEFNCYTNVSEKNQKIYDRAAAGASVPQLFYLGLMMALWSNITAEPLPDNMRRRFFELAFGEAESRAKETEEILEFVKTITSLSAEFREYTTRSYFRLYGCEKEFDQALVSTTQDARRVEWVSDYFHDLVDSLYRRVSAKQEEIRAASPAAVIAQSA